MHLDRSSSATNVGRRLNPRDAAFIELMEALSHVLDAARADGFIADN
jgi:hypothetical protein